LRVPGARDLRFQENRMPSRAAALLAAVLLPFAALACSNGDDSGGEGGSAPGGLPCDVDGVLAQGCRSCHAAEPRYGAPMPLVTRADLTAPAPSDGSRKVYELVAERIHDDMRPMPPPPNARLDAADAAALDAWAAAGAPAGAEACGGAGGGGGGGGSALGCTPDITLKPATPWVMPQDTQDIYVCYGVDVEVPAKRHMIGLEPNIDNSTIVHHMLLYQADTSFDPTPGPCGGGSKGRLVGVWAPGGQALELPPEAGFPMEGTIHYVLQIHYSNLMGLDGQQDSTGYRLCTTDALRPNDADILAFGTIGINIPAHGSQDVTCEFTVPDAVGSLHVLAGMPHMHKLGRVISTHLEPGGSGAPVDLGTADPWNFDSQIWTTLDVTANGGDLVRTRCAWDNPGDTDVTFGEQTSDEMCFGFAMYYPKIEAQGFFWGLPAALSSCAPTQ
jgi:hypothetical protein